MTCQSSQEPDAGNTSSQHVAATGRHGKYMASILRWAAVLEAELGPSVYRYRTGWVFGAQVGQLGLRWQFLEGS